MKDRKKRTQVDFSKHELIIIDDKLSNDKYGNIVIHDLKIPDSIMNRVTFINTRGICIVTGDFGHWTLCREFHPAADGHISDSYWLEKLRISSTQVLCDYDSEETEKTIQEEIDSGLEEYGYEGEQLKELKEWYKSLLDHTCDEADYIYHAYYDCYRPNILDNESIPLDKKVNIRLKIIFDAFEEICSRLK